MSTYRWFRVRAPERSWMPAHDRLLAAGLAGDDVWGVLHGLFGLGSNELFVVVHGDRDVGAVFAEAGVEVTASHVFEPTVRPRRFEPLDADGLYVFRFFDIDHDNVDEIARLSAEAWTTFEGAADYEAEPQALFAEADRAATTGVMLLVTWYDGFDSWQTSRTPAPGAADNFRRRRELTNGTIAYATRLVS